MLFLVLHNVFDGGADGFNLLGFLVGDLDLELFLELHHQLDNIEGIGAQVFLKGGLVGNLFLADAKPIADDLDDFRANALAAVRRSGFFSHVSPLSRVSIFRHCGKSTACGQDTSEAVPWEGVLLRRLPFWQRRDLANLGA
jgi:hypothetical protein